MQDAPLRPATRANAVPSVHIVSPTPRLVVRAREPSDIDAIASLRAMPSVRWGTLAMPLVSKDAERRAVERFPDSVTAIVAEIDDTIVGAAELFPLKGRRSHIGKIGISVHDAHRRQGIGLALMGALLDLADNWLNLSRLELEVFIDNVGAIRLYERLGFTVEGTARQAVFRDGRFVDAHYMARIRSAA